MSPAASQPPISPLPALRALGNALPAIAALANRPYPSVPSPVIALPPLLPQLSSYLRSHPRDRVPSVDSGLDGGWGMMPEIPPIYSPSSVSVTICAGLEGRAEVGNEWLTRLKMSFIWETRIK